VKILFYGTQICAPAIWDYNPQVEDKGKIRNIICHGVDKGLPEYAYHSLGGKSERPHSLCRLSFEYPAQHFEQDQRPEKDTDTAAHSNKEGQI
jgi:hypothetical protein